MEQKKEVLNMIISEYIKDCTMVEREGVDTHFNGVRAFCAFVNTTGVLFYNDFTLF